MPFQIIRNDITKVKADAIVNTANPDVAVGRGTDCAIYHAAGRDRLLAERKKIGIMHPGQAAHRLMSQHFCGNIHTSIMNIGNSAVLFI